MVVNFWATWCVPCIQEIPEIAAFASASIRDVVVIGVAMDAEDAAKVKQFAPKVGHDYPLVLSDDDGREAAGRAAGRCPRRASTIPAGKVVYDRPGA